METDWWLIVGFVAICYLVSKKKVAFNLFRTNSPSTATESIIKMYYFVESAMDSSFFWGYASFAKSDVDNLGDDADSREIVQSHNTHRIVCHDRMCRSCVVFGWISFARRLPISKAFRLFATLVCRYTLTYFWATQRPLSKREIRERRRVVSWSNSYSNFEEGCRDYLSRAGNK